MQIVSVGEGQQNLWDSYVLQHKEAVPYHLFGWRHACHVGYGLDAVYLLAQEEGTPVGALPMILFKGPLRQRRLVSLPYCDLGGILADNEEVATGLLQRAFQEARSLNISCLDLRNSCPRDSRPSTCGDVPVKVRMVLDLPPSSEHLLQGLKSKLRSQVKKPLRDGLVGKLGGAELLDDFYSVFTRNMRDLGSPVHGRKWLAAVVLHYGDRAKIGVVYTPQGEPAAAGIILMTDETVAIPWASSLRQLNFLNPNMLLYWIFLSFAADNGFRRFDFGRSTPGEGTYRFKEQWGAIPVPLSWQNFRSEVLLSSQAGHSVIGRGLVEKAWALMPQHFCNSLGPRLRRYISL